MDIRMYLKLIDNFEYKINKGVFCHILTSCIYNEIHEYFKSKSISK